MSRFKKHYFTPDTGLVTVEIGLTRQVTLISFKSYDNLKTKDGRL